MGGIENGEPPLKRAKISLEDLHCTKAASSSLGKSMARSLLSHGDGETIGSNGVIKKPEFIRIITRALYSLGFDKTGALLEEESGIQLHSSAVNLFSQLVLDGKWDESIVTLHKIGISDKTVVKSATLLILEQKYFEFLRKGPLEVNAALGTLQNEIVPLCIGLARVRNLTNCLVSSSLWEVFGFSKEDTDKKIRLKTLEKLQELLPASIMIPEKRLEHLVEQALDVQRDACTFHNTFDSELSLYSDHHCGTNRIPSHTLQILKEHTDEVWFVQFSHNGQYLASASKDQSAIIWEVDEGGPVLLKYKLLGHQKPVSTVSWSPDDQQLLTCGVEEVVRRWDVSSGTCLHVYEKADVSLISCGWLPDGRCIFSGMTDRSICMWDLDGTELQSWNSHRTINISDMAITDDGKSIISRNRENEISLFDRELNFELPIKEEDAITSFSLSNDNKYLLVSLVNQEIHLWTIEEGGVRKVLSRYKGHKRARFVIRSCFGGFEQAFIASGSEDSQVYIWHRSMEEPLSVLPGHSGSVSCVSWNPAKLHMLASGSDDHTVRIWGVDHIKMKPDGYHQSNGIPIHSNGGTHYG